MAATTTMLRILSIAPAYRLVITLVFVAVVIALSIAPGIERPGDSMFNWIVINTAKPIQKAMHVAVYALLAMLWMWTLESVESRAIRLGLTLIVCVGLGAVLEWHQTRVPGRFGTVADVVLNVIGVIAGLIAALIFL